MATRDALTEARAVTQELGDITQLDTAKNGQLVHAAGAVETKDMLSDPVFGLSINAIRLERSVEFYQWVEDSKSEKKKKLGGGEETVTTYTYAAKWTAHPVDSSGFKDPKARTENRNVVLAAMENFKVQAANVSFGAYRLPDFMVNSIGGGAPVAVALPEATKTALNKQMTLAAQQAKAALPQVQRPEGVDLVSVSGDTVFLGASPGMPQIGDVRVSFKETKPGVASILAQVNGNTFEQYHARNGKTVGMLSMGTHSLENMYGDAQSANATMTWILRLVGLLLVVFGLKMIVAPLEVLASFIPLLGSIVGAGTGLVSALLGFSWSLVVVSIAWLRFRPVVGIVMLVAAGVLIGLLHGRGRARKAAIAQAAATKTAGSAEN
ncbi:MAG: TMEM43 family protein [Desulfobulbus sp.]|nr:TMEM43 family protein [Desulfobulbus sp.]